MESVYIYYSLVMIQVIIIAYTFAYQGTALLWAVIIMNLETARDIAGDGAITTNSVISLRESELNNGAYWRFNKAKDVIDIQTSIMSGSQSIRILSLYIIPISILLYGGFSMGWLIATSLSIASCVVGALAGTKIANRDPSFIRRNILKNIGKRRLAELKIDSYLQSERK